MKLKCCPCVVAAIIEKKFGTKRKILIQERWKPDVDPEYSGFLELPGGLVEPYEPLLESLGREVREETGLVVSSVGSCAALPFAVSQQYSGGLPWVGLVYRCKARGEICESSNEARNHRWVEIKELRRLLRNGRVFPLYVGPLDKYCAEVRS